MCTLSPIISLYYRLKMRGQYEKKEKIIWDTGFSDC